MSKQVFELIELLIKIEENFSRVYKNISSINGKYAPKIKTAASVLASQEATHAQRYRDILKKTELATIYIDDSVYEKALMLLTAFKEKIKLEHVYEIREFVEYAVHFERENAIMLNKILEELDAESDKAFQDLLKHLIHVEKEHSATLETFIRE